jgi:uncharacterized protein (TIGR02599 family)
LKNHPSIRNQRGFTLIEIMVATVIMVILMGIIFQLTASMADIWRSTSGKISAFQAARNGFEAMSRSLEQATLMTYLDYVDNNTPPQPRPGQFSTNWAPSTYARASELHFVSGPATELLPASYSNATQSHAVFFQAPLGVASDTKWQRLNQLLNSVGFYVEYTDEKPVWPQFIRDILGSQDRYRFRLMQWIEPTEKLSVYTYTKPAQTQNNSYSYSLNWFKNGIPNPGASPSGNQTRARVIADNVIAVFFRPRLSIIDEDLLDNGTVDSSATGGLLAPTYRYDSRAWTNGFIVQGPVNLRTAMIPGTSGRRYVDLMRNQLPPLMDVVLVAIDSLSADRLCRQSTIHPTLAVPNGTFELRGQPNAANFLFNPDGSGSSDLEKFEAQLGNAGVNFRVFKATLTMKGAKWSVD